MAGKVIELSDNESLILFELLNRILEFDDLSTIREEPESLVLANLLSLLEEQMSEPFCENYQEALRQARSIIIKGLG